MKFLLLLLFAIIPLIPQPACAAGASAPLVNQQDSVYLTQTGKTLIYAKQCLFMGFSPVSTTVGVATSYSLGWFDALSVATALTQTANVFSGFMPYVPGNLTVTGSVGYDYPVNFLGPNGTYCANGLVVNVDADTNTIFGNVLYIPLQ